MYRLGDISDTHDENQMNPPDDPQFEGVIFADGKCAIRWLTAKRSVTVWDSFEDMMDIHGHPEYGSRLIWREVQDVNPAELELAKLKQAVSEVYYATKWKSTDGMAEKDADKLWQALRDAAGFEKGKSPKPAVLDLVDP
jgi:hypothetical protein